MEASAFLHVCDHMNVESLGVIKGVSDAGDSKKAADAESYKPVIWKTADAIEKWLIYRWTGVKTPALPPSRYTRRRKTGTFLIRPRTWLPARR